MDIWKDLKHFYVRAIYTHILKKCPLSSRLSILFYEIKSLCFFLFSAIQGEYTPYIVNKKLLKKKKQPDFVLNGKVARATIR